MWLLTQKRRMMDANRMQSYLKKDILQPGFENIMEEEEDIILCKMVLQYTLLIIPSMYCIRCLRTDW
jgi:hypothetical protein